MRVMGTGHRPAQYLTMNRDYRLSLDCFKDCIHKAFLDANIRPTSILSGMATGFDTALAEYAVENDIDLLAYLPYIGQEYKWCRDSQVLYRKLLLQATQITIAVNYVPTGYKEAAQALHIRNSAMVRDCDAAVVFYNPSITTGGTYSTVKKIEAKQLSAPYMNVWDDVVNLNQFELNI